MPRDITLLKSRVLVFFVYRTQFVHRSVVFRKRGGNLRNIKHVPLTELHSAIFVSHAGTDQVFVVDPDVPPAVVARTAGDRASLTIARSSCANGPSPASFKNSSALARCPLPLLSPFRAHRVLISIFGSGAISATTVAKVCPGDHHRATLIERVRAPIGGFCLVLDQRARARPPQLRAEILCGRRTNLEKTNGARARLHHRPLRPARLLPLRCPISVGRPRHRRIQGCLWLAASSRVGLSPPCLTVAHGVPAACLHPQGRDRPKRCIHVHLIPSCVACLATSRCSQSNKLDGAR